MESNPGPAAPKTDASTHTDRQIETETVTVTRQMDRKTDRQRKRERGEEGREEKRTPFPKPVIATASIRPLNLIHLVVDMWSLNKKRKKQKEIGYCVRDLYPFKERNKQSYPSRNSTSC